VHSGNASFRGVLSSAKIGTASWRYYQREVATSPSEYFLADGEAPGRWWGGGLDQLGLTRDGVVGEAELEALFARALHPGTGARLGRSWRSDGVAGYDLTFSAPKSVSALWAIGGAETARQVAAGHAAAVRAGLDYLQAQAAVSRRGRDGAEQVNTGGFAAAVFDHRTSRAGDPQLHSHALVVNKVRCADGQWRTIDGHEVYHFKKAAGTVYQAALRAELTGRLGVAFEAPNRHGQAEIVGVPAELVRLWSKRTAAINADAATAIDRFENDLGRELTAAERAKVVKTSVLKTRPGKTHADPGVLHHRWAAEAARHGWTGTGLGEAVARAATGRRVTGRNRHVDQVTTYPALDPYAQARVVQEALSGVGRRQAVFSRADVAAQVAAILPARPGTADQVCAEVEQLARLALADPEAVEIGVVQDGSVSRGSDVRWTTATHLAVEARIMLTASAGRTAGRGVVRAPVARVAAEAAGLSADQRAAVDGLTGGGQQIAVLIAPAGAGKTRTVGAAAAAWRAAGYDVVGLAPSARAAVELSAAVGARADTVAKWLHDQDATGVPGGHPPGRGLGAGTVLVVDEAAMLATTHLAALSHATASGGKLVLVGDPAQIGPVEAAGGLLPDLARRVGAVELSTVHRFTHPWEAQASQLLRQGESAVLNLYAGQDRIHPAVDADAALDAVHTRWAEAVRGGQDALMMARSRADVDALNHRARAAALKAGAVCGPVLVTAAGMDWQAGDLLRTRRNDRRLPVGDTHVRNGDRFCVVTAAPDGGLVVEDLTGRGRTVLPHRYLTRHATYGWASTIDGAQGATADVGMLLTRPGLDREHLYVGMTRGRHANHVHVTGTADGSVEHPCTAAESVATLAEATKALQAAAAQIGAQQSAHALLRQARSLRRRRPDSHIPTPPSTAVLRRQATVRRPAVHRSYDSRPPPSSSAPSMSR